MPDKNKNGKKNAPHDVPVPPAPVRGGGIADLAVQEDFGAGTMSFTVDTRVDMRFPDGKGDPGNVAEFKSFVTKLQKGKYKTNPKILKSMIDFLDGEVVAFGTTLPEQLKAKNMFRAAFGLPPLPENADRPGGA